MWNRYDKQIREVASMKLGTLLAACFFLTACLTYPLTLKM